MLGSISLSNSLKSCYLAVLVGTSSGLSYRQLKKHPRKLKKVAKVSALAGAAGAVIGSAYAFLRKRRDVYLAFDTLKGGFSLSIISGSFTGIREALIISDDLPWTVTIPKSRLYQQTAAAGAITGFLVGSFWWSSFFRVISTSAGSCAMAATGQLFIDKINAWKRRKAIREHFPELAELEWLLLEEEEKQIIIKNQQGWISRFLEVLQDRPESAKLQIKIDGLKEELQLLDDEESRLNEKLGITGNSTNEDVQLVQ